jgi:CRP-like cAMP-binding protein
VDASDLQLLETVGDETTVSAGQVLIERGQHGSGLYVVLDGTVIVEADEGPRELGPGCVVGERALLSDDGTRTARVRAKTDVRAIAVDRVAFERLCNEDSGLAERVRAAGR